MKVSSGMNLREAVAYAKGIGCTVVKLPGTGELMISHPTWDRRIRINGRRKDAPRALTTALRGTKEGA